MKKIFNKTLHMVLAVLMLLAAIAPAAFAADDGTLTIRNTVDGKVYDIYRVFDMTYTQSGEDKLYVYTRNANFTDFFATEYGVDTDVEAVAIVSAMQDDSVELNEFAEKVKEYIFAADIPSTASETADDTTLVFDQLPYGYYLVYPQGGLTAACSLTTTDPNGTVIVKTTYPKIEKSIEEGGEDKGASTNAVGDVVTFKLLSHVPDMVGYTKYTYTVKDTMSPGLTLNRDSIAIIVGARELDEDVEYTVDVDNDTADTIITIEFVDFLTEFADNKGDAIVITYTAVLNDEAIVGDAGNPNKVDLTYSNDPRDEISTDTTPENEVIVYTFELELEKVDAADTSIKLDGVVFSLWTTTEIEGADTKQYPEEGPDPVTLYAIKQDLTTGADGKFAYTIKAGTYYLFEETAKEGYNKMLEPIIFTITPTIDADSLELENVTIDNEDLSWDGSTGKISTTVLNRSGLLLPSTGGQGIVIFSLIGGVLMLGALIAFIIHRKKRSGNHS